MTAAPHLVKAFLDIDEALGAHGVPRQGIEGSYWRHEVERFYSHPTAKVLVECVGRGGGKDLVSLKMELAETLAGRFSIPTGERHYAIRVSENITEAGKTRRILAQFLHLLNVAATPSGEMIDLVDLPRGFLVLACRVGAVSGWRALSWTANECAKWDSEGTNPSAEVVASIKAMTVTHPEARGRVFSSPMGKAGHFYELLERGDTAEQLVGGPTASWVANPSITEEHTRSLEPDPRVWAREYQAQPAESESAAFAPEMIDPCIGLVPMEALDRPVIALDSSMGRGDAFTWCAAQWGRPYGDEIRSHLWMVDVRGRGLVREDLVRAGELVTNGQVCPARDDRGVPIPNPRAGWKPPPRLAVSRMRAIEGRFAQAMTADEVMDLVAQDADQVGARHVIGDMFQAFFIESAAAKRGLRYRPLAWTNESKGRAVLRVRMWFREETIAIEPGDEATKLRGELLSFREKITPSGAVTFGARGGTHDDRVALLLVLAMADTDDEHLLRGSPLRPSHQRHEIRTVSEHVG